MKLKLGDRVKSIHHPVEYIVIGLRYTIDATEVRVMMAPEYGWEAMEHGWHVLVLNEYICAPEDLRVLD